MQLDAAALAKLRTMPSLVRLMATETASPEQIRSIEVLSPWFANYLQGRRRRGVHALGTRWKELLL